MRLTPRSWDTGDLPNMQTPEATEPEHRGATAGMPGRGHRRRRPRLSLFDVVLLTAVTAMFVAIGVIVGIAALE